MLHLESRRGKLRVFLLNLSLPFSICCASRLIVRYNFTFVGIESPCDTHSGRKSCRVNGVVGGETKDNTYGSKTFKMIYYNDLPTPLHGASRHGQREASEARVCGSIVVEVIRTKVFKGRRLQFVFRPIQYHSPGYPVRKPSSCVCLKYASA